jgi:hypothetical protein
MEALRPAGKKPNYVRASMLGSFTITALMQRLTIGGVGRQTQVRSTDLRCALRPPSSRVSRIDYPPWSRWRRSIAHPLAGSP